MSVKKPISENLKIEIRAIENSNMQEFSKELKYFARPKTICPLVNPKTHKYESGLSEEDKKYLESTGFPYNISDTYKKGVPHEFWESELVKYQLKQSPDFLYPGKSDLDFVKYRFLTKSKFVYASEQDMLAGGKPQATHYIYDESNEIEVKATKIQAREKLIKKISALSLVKKREYITILFDEIVDNKTEGYLTIKFNEAYEDKEKSARLVELLNNSPEKLELMATVKEALLKGVLTKNKKGIYYFETNLGYSEDEVLDTLSSDSNQELFLTIKSKL